MIDNLIFDLIKQIWTNLELYFEKSYEIFKFLEIFSIFFEFFEIFMNSFEFQIDLFNLKSIL